MAELTGNLGGVVTACRMKPTGKIHGQWVRSKGYTLCGCVVREIKGEANVAVGDINCHRCSSVMARLQSRVTNLSGAPLA